MTDFIAVEHAGTRIIEGVAGVGMLARPRDITRLLEACFNGRARAALLHAENLPGRFFDLSSGEAGEILQKLRSYGGIRLAVVAPAGAAESSTLFSAMESHERGEGYFGVFDDVVSARTWLATR